MFLRNITRNLFLNSNALVSNSSSYSLRLFHSGNDENETEHNKQTTNKNNKTEVDYSQYPVLCEKDLEEKYMIGSGPGGQAVNKTFNCIQLRHVPTNIIVKCHKHRMASWNRKEARKLLLDKLDEKLNGLNSVANQLKSIQMKKGSTASYKRKKLNEMKAKWKDRENIE